MKQKEEKAGSAQLGNRLPLNIVIVEGTSQAYAYRSIMFYQFIKAYFEGELEELIKQVKKERDDFLHSRGR